MRLFRSSLDQVLPPEVIAGMTWGPFRYRRYPVFSLPWLMGRLYVSCMVVGIYGALSALAQKGAGESWRDAWQSTGYFFIGFMLMLTVGPALASLVRYRGFSTKPEGWAVVAAVALGFIAGMGADAWSSNQIKKSLHYDKEVPAAERKISTLDEATLKLANLGAGFLYFACGGGLAALAYFSERRRLSARASHLGQLEANMRLAILQAQVEPHFLFNTLAAIRPLIRQDANRAEAAIDAFSNHLRATIPQMREQSVVSTLGQQIDICESYLTLMQVRMGSRLWVEIQVPAEMRALEFPPLILLSLVENAIKHGIEPKPGAGQIEVQAAVTGSTLQVSVADDGAGLKDGLNSGLGLSNIREQLKVRFAERAALSIAARPEGGTLAEVAIPLAQLKA